MTLRAPNLIDKIAGLIPGYTSFTAKEGRRDADKRLRDHVAGVLDETKRHVDDVVLEMTKAARLDGLDEADRLKRRIDTCANLVRHAEYGESGFMDDRVVDEADLERLYDHDLTLLKSAKSLAEGVRGLTAENLGEEVGGLRRGTDEFLAAIEERTAILREVF